MMAVTIDQVVHANNKVVVTTATGEVAHEFSSAEYRILEELYATIEQDRPAGPGEGDYRPVEVDWLCRNYMGCDHSVPLPDQVIARQVIADLIGRGYIEEAAPGMVTCTDAAVDAVNFGRVSD